MLRSLGLAFLLYLFSSGAAWAASAVVIWPVDPQIESTEKATALWLENRGAEPVTLQIRSLAWSQTGGQDNYGSQTNVVASPPVSEIAPGQRQLIRVIKTKQPIAGSEGSYRLLIDELPKPIVPDATARASAGLAIQMRYSIPLFVHGETVNRKSPVTGLSASIQLINGERYIQIVNRGAVHARLTDLSIDRSGHSFTVASGLAGYVLPGATMRWRIPDDAPLGGAIHANVNGVAQTLSTSA